MTDILFTMVRQWTAQNSEQLNEDGFIIQLMKGCAPDGDSQTVLELESREHLGRLAVKETGEAQIACGSFDGSHIQRGDLRVFTEEQIDNAMHCLLSWMGEDISISGNSTLFDCPEGKQTYVTKREARSVIQRAHLPNTVDPYRCPHCRQWHLGTPRSKGIKRRPIKSK
jgi:hypothetical protein